MASRQLSESALSVIESASKLLEHDGYIIRPGLYDGWAAVSTSQGQTLGYVCVLLPSE